jgi:hypothetical protein
MAEFVDDPVGTGGCQKKEDKNSNSCEVAEFAEKKESKYGRHCILFLLLALAVFLGLLYWMLSRLMSRLLHIFTVKMRLSSPIVFIFEELVYAFMRFVVFGFLVLSVSAWILAP